MTIAEQYKFVCHSDGSVCEDGCDAAPIPGKMDELETLLAAKDAFNARINEMHETLDGCDWCCGGGDQEMTEIVTRIAEIDKALGL